MREEKMLPDGRIKVCTSAPFGFEVPSLSGLFGETWGIRFLTPHAPDQAERLWQILKQDYVSRNPDGGLDFKPAAARLGHAQPADFSRWPELNPLIVTLWAALEMGDDEIVAATRNEITKRNGEGIADAMTWSGRNTIRNMVTKGLPEAWATGPILAEATYPQVIVARGDRRQRAQPRPPFRRRGGQVRSRPVGLFPRQGRDRGVHPRDRRRGRANAVSAGPTLTETVAALVASDTTGAVAAVNGGLPPQRMADPREIAEAVLFLASDRASFVTGQVFHANGGGTMA